MDPIELARQHARRLHDEAVQRGRNPWSPYEFAVGVANDLGITVETCACLLYTSPSPRDKRQSRMPSSA